MPKHVKILMVQSTVFNLLLSTATSLLSRAEVFTGATYYKTRSMFLSLFSVSPPHFPLFSIFFPFNTLVGVFSLQDENTNTDIYANALQLISQKRPHASTEQK